VQFSQAIAVAEAVNNPVRTKGIGTQSRILYTKPSITEREIAYATDAVANGWGEHCYDYLNRFEAAFASHLGVKYAIATSSCTGALPMGLAALGIFGAGTG
jgi:perosamine synthetase